MQTSLQKRIKDACDRSHGEVKFRDNYSGRGMYGKECIGITGSSSACKDLIAEVIIEMRDDPNNNIGSTIKFLMNYRWDNMGLNVIFYWPHLSIMEYREENL